MLGNECTAHPEASMQKPELTTSWSERRLDQMAVPGLIQVIEDFRRAYPQLPLDVIRWVLRQPAETNDGGEPPAEV